jgi:hypothetical protein
MEEYYMSLQRRNHQLSLKQPEGVGGSGFLFFFLFFFPSSIFLVSFVFLFLVSSFFIYFDS